jgi:hypothetical protein
MAVNLTDSRIATGDKVIMLIQTALGTWCLLVLSHGLDCASTGSYQECGVSKLTCMYISRG